MDGWCSVARPRYPPTPITLRCDACQLTLCSAAAPLGLWWPHAVPRPGCDVVVGFGELNPPRRPVVWWWVLGYLTPFCGVVWCGGGLWVSPLPVVRWWVSGSGFRV